ncbi:MAG: phosphatidate cytidylyltransferase [Bacteroides sp.]|nr:phosphatidate cytidylyltransferase [Bacteroides sp.]
MMKNFIQRAITGLIFVAVLIGCIIGSPLSFGLLFSIISAMATAEFCNLMNKHEGVCVNRNICVLGSVSLFLCFFYYGMNPAQTGIFIPYLIITIYLMVSELYLKKKHPLNSLAYAMLSQIYVGLPFALLNVLAFHSNGWDSVSEYQFILPLSIFAFNWINDTGAYCTGMLLGKHPLFKRISPKKSWEGSIGGAVFSIAGAFALAHFFPIMSTVAWVGMGLTVVVFGTWGDLTESLMKRHLGIKDSGNILPGHGGMLDRFDSAIMAIPAAVVYLYLISLF